MKEYKKRFSYLKKVKQASGLSYIKILLDFYKAKKAYGVSIKNYYEYEFERQDTDFKNSFLHARTKSKFLKILNPHKYRFIARNKYLAHILLENLAIPTAKLYFYYDPSIKCVNEKTANDYNSVLNLLKKYNIKEVVVKTTESFHGEGVVVYKDIIIEEDTCFFVKFDDTQYRLRELLGKSPLVFESYINQTKQMQSLNASSVNTLRFMTTLYPDGHVELVNVFIKIGRGNSCVDNAGEGGNVDAAIDLETGTIKYVIKFDGIRKITPITNHPDSNNIIEGVCIENWEEIKKNILDFQSRIPFIRVIGWDVALTDSGPIIVEINDYWDELGQLFLRKGWYNEIKSCYDSWAKYLE